MDSTYSYSTLGTGFADPFVQKKREKEVFWLIHALGVRKQVRGIPKSNGPQKWGP